VLPEAPLAALAAGRGRNVDLLIGTTSEEANAFLKPLRLDRFMPGFAARWMLGKAIPRSRDVLAAYGAGHGTRQGEALARALTDLALVWPAHQYAAAHTGRTHVYSFDWRSPTAGIGACRSLDLPFVFDTLDAVAGPKGTAGPRPPQEVARRVHSLWVDFAQSGDLPWPEFEASSRQVRLLSADLTVHADIPPVAAFSAALPPA
jgi:para-nitrobenzyl esterase